MKLSLTNSTLFALTLSAGAAFAEPVTVENHNDGVTWNSYTASRACIKAVVKNALGNDAEIIEREGSISGITFSNNTSSSEVIINLEQAWEKAGYNPIIASITHGFHHDYRPAHGFENYAHAGRGGLMSYEPQSLEMGVVKHPDENWSPQMQLVHLMNGAFAESGYGESEYDAEAFVRDIDQRLRACDLSM